MRSKSTSTIVRRAGIWAMGCMALAWATPAFAQLNGENLLGDMGVKSGTQPDPGIYVSSIYYRYESNTIKDANGRRLTLDMSGEAVQTIQAGMPLLWYVTPKKIFGGNFAMMAVLPVASGSLEAPAYGLSEKASTGLSDMYIMPAQLGWHFKRGDVIAGVGLFVPTGRHHSGASDNLGKGMWSYELSGGGTLYLDEQRSFSIATTAFWEAHSKKDGEVRVENVSIHDVEVGQLLTLEGGVGKTFFHGALSFGVAYYAQWKVSADTLSLSPSLMQSASVPAKHYVWGLGPDVTIPIATKSRLLSLVNVRYLWEQDARLKTQGQTFLITNTIPVGGVKIPSKSTR
jgi:hypothetical protein